MQHAITWAIWIAGGIWIAALAARELGAGEAIRAWRHQRRLVITVRTVPGRRPS